MGTPMYIDKSILEQTSIARMVDAVNDDPVADSTLIYTSADVNGTLIESVDLSIEMTDVFVGAAALEPVAFTAALTYAWLVISDGAASKHIWKSVELTLGISPITPHWVESIPGDGLVLPNGFELYGAHVVDFNDGGVPAYWPIIFSVRGGQLA